MPIAECKPSERQLDAKGRLICTIARPMIDFYLELPTLRRRHKESWTASTGIGIWHQITELHTDNCGSKHHAGT